MVEILDGVRDNPVLRHKTIPGRLSDDHEQPGRGIAAVPQKNSTMSGVSRPRFCADALRAKNLNVHLIGRPPKPKSSSIKITSMSVCRLPAAKMIYRQVENSFTQPNAAMNIQMLEWALDATKEATGDLLELYCGNGNFSLALARNFDRVLATEIRQTVRSRRRSTTLRLTILITCRLSVWRRKSLRRP
ncbi:tRNA (uracil(54)-C(5))-methyltransferase [Raoultella planticola]|uniref:tRNA (Uracil(54)-C(5))-methyltransferase n=1 Tax=Raoultella planticola TaxID=575 RepID=A0A485BEN7_RAOPL|nr:tRNA (uracil(54)-C(5))-methyltransferase [Raoultella planticola]